MKLRPWKLKIRWMRNNGEKKSVTWTRDSRKKCLPLGETWKNCKRNMKNLNGKLSLTRSLQRLAPNGSRRAFLICDGSSLCLNFLGRPIDVKCHYSLCLGVVYNLLYNYLQMRWTKLQTTTKMTMINSFCFVVFSQLLINKSPASLMKTVILASDNKSSSCNKQNSRDLIDSFMRNFLVWLEWTRKLLCFITYKVFFGLYKVWFELTDCCCETWWEYFRHKVSKIKIPAWHVAYIYYAAADRIGKSFLIDHAEHPSSARSVLYY